MSFKSSFRRSLQTCVVVALALLATSRGDATVVRFNSVLGNIDVRLYNTATPLSTANFLNYATGGDWVDTFIHRSVPGFIVQGGGFTFPTGATSPLSVPQDPPVLNEPGISNLRGTIAFAKIGPPAGQQPTPTTINSATNQWFFNLADNSGNLDSQNGGFTVFGRVVGNGMTVADAIAALPRVNAGSPFDTLPVRNFSGGNITKANLVTFNTILPLNLPNGDYNFDGKVDGADLAVWKADFGSTTKAEADGNGNGKVDAADLLVWQRSFGQNFGAPAAAAVAAVPEPAAATLALLAAAACGLARRRHR
ncbi:peptidylprolyl isomerase [Lacipirellula limnantheis]|uniref:peptidylprolyl isomerase n=1 Tax=Lacipirellula limnantheis TaxID=2528024 RepID=A0A517U583_9BACT|nr:peptidylprolyl isomerase [Lacipirellula limnantheis]QDT75782.1 Peptidyl-prolyl cis-trans isomerase A precursor [Lacipirellula limnantheis]